MKGRDGTGRVGAVERSLWLQSGVLVALGTRVWRQLVLLTLAELGTGAVRLPPGPGAAAVGGSRCSCSCLNPHQAWCEDARAKCSLSLEFRKLIL